MKYIVKKTKPSRQAFRIDSTEPVSNNLLKKGKVSSSLCVQLLVYMCVGFFRLALPYLIR